MCVRPPPQNRQPREAMPVLVGRPGSISHTAVSICGVGGGVSISNSLGAGEAKGISFEDNKRMLAGLKELIAREDNRCGPDRDPGAAVGAAWCMRPF